MKKFYSILFCVIVTLSLFSCSYTAPGSDKVTSESEDDLEITTSIENDNFRPENADYTVSIENGSCYVIFDDISKYNTTNDGQSQLATITFDSIYDLRTAIIEGKLTDGQKKIMMSSFKKDGDKIKICDVNNLYEPRLPEGFKVSEVYWAGEAYSFAIECDSTVGYIHYYPESDYLTIFENDYTNYFNKETITVNNTETLTDRNSTATYYFTPMAELKQVRYTITQRDLSVTVDETYTLSASILLGNTPSDSVPSNVTLYCSAKNVSYVVDIFELTERPDEAFLSSFLLTELE